MQEICRIGKTFKQDCMGLTLYQNWASPSDCILTYYILCFLESWRSTGLPRSKWGFFRKNRVSLFKRRTSYAMNIARPSWLVVNWRVCAENCKDTTAHWRQVYYGPFVLDAEYTFYFFFYFFYYHGLHKPRFPRYIGGIYRHYSNFFLFFFFNAIGSI